VPPVELDDAFRPALPLLVAALSAVTTTLALAQDPGKRLIDDAFAQANARNLDSAETLIRDLLNSSHAGSDQHAAALVLRGVIAYYRGTDSAARVAFSEVLAARPTLREDWLFKTDSGLWVIWREEQGRPFAGRRTSRQWSYSTRGTQRRPPS
jgi:hypothetical protein